MILLLYSLIFLFFCSFLNSIFTFSLSFIHFSIRHQSNFTNIPFSVQEFIEKIVRGVHMLPIDEDMKGFLQSLAEDSVSEPMGIHSFFNHMRTDSVTIKVVHNEIDQTKNTLRTPRVALYERERDHSITSFTSPFLKQYLEHIFKFHSFIFFFSFLFSFFDYLT